MKLSYPNTTFNKCVKGKTMGSIMWLQSRFLLAGGERVSFAKLVQMYSQVCVMSLSIPCFLRSCIYVNFIV